MKYFTCKNDRELSNLVKVSLPETAFDSKEPIVVFTDLADNTECPDLLFVDKMLHSAVLATDRSKKLIECYVKEMTASPVILMDNKRRRHKNYWKVTIDEIDAVKNKEKGKLLRSEELILQKDRMKDSHLFEAHVEDDVYWISSLVFAENFMRKNYYGVEWIRVQAE